MRKILIGISVLFLVWVLDHRFCYSESSGTENHKNEYTAKAGYYYERYAYEEADNSGFGTIFLDMSYAGRFYDKITFGAGFVGHLLKCWEEKEDDYDDSVENKFVLKEFYLKSDISDLSLILGRHAIDQSFIMTDYYEGITLVSDENERLDFHATYAIKTGSAFED